MQSKSSLTSFSSSLSTLALSLLPVFKSCPPCALCMPKYAALLSFLGLPLADYSAYLTPLMWISMAVTFISMAWQGPRQYGDRKPSFIVLIACAFIAMGKTVDETFIVYSGMGLLFIALVWHQWRIRNHRHEACGSEKGCCSKHS